MSNRPRLQQPLVQFARKTTLEQAHVGSIQIIPTTGSLAWMATNIRHNQHGDKKKHIVMWYNPTYHHTRPTGPCWPCHCGVSSVVDHIEILNVPSYRNGGKIYGGTNVTKMRRYYSQRIERCLHPCHTCWVPHRGDSTTTIEVIPKKYEPT
jgi:hypothetical protein